MPAKHPFRASLGDVAKKKLDVIIEYEEKKAGLDSEGKQIKLTPKEIIEELINVRHELIAGGVTNRQRLGGMSDELKALRAEIIELKQTIGMLADLIKGEKEDVQPSDNQPSE